MVWMSLIFVRAGSFLMLSHDRQNTAENCSVHEALYGDETFFRPPESQSLLSNESWKIRAKKKTNKNHRQVYENKEDSKTNSPRRFFNRRYWFTSRQTIVSYIKKKNDLIRVTVRHHPVVPGPASSGTL